MIFKRVDVTTFDPLRSLLHRGQHYFGGLLVIAQGDWTRLAIRVGHAAPKGFRLFTDTPCSECPLRDLLAFGVDVANDRRAIGSGHVELLSLHEFQSEVSCQLVGHVQVQRTLPPHEKTQ